MVQTVNPLRQADFFSPTRDTNWHSVDRTFLDPTQDGRFTSSHPSSLHSRALTIEAALRDCVRLPVKEFALIVQLENGDERTYTSQSLTPCQPRIFSDRFRQDFHRSIRRKTLEAGYPSSIYQDAGNLFPEFPTDGNRKFSSSGGSSSGGRSRRQYQRQSRSEESDDTDSGKGKRKRVRGPQYSTFDNDDTPMPVPVVKASQLIIGNEAEVETFYHTRFKEMQQSSCKVMGKVFVKLVEPKKQTHYPYTKGDDMAPPWWPLTSITVENHVRHKEPDHLLRPERIRLLVHILKMIIEPYEKQCPTIQKGRLNVAKLEEVTMETMSGWFNDPEHPGNIRKRPYLKEIFKVAKAEERYKNGEIDKDTRIPVMYGDRNGVDSSDDETEEGVKDEDEEGDTNQIPSSIPTPDSMVSQPMMQAQHLQHVQEQEPNGMFMGPTRPLPMRHQTQPVMDETPSYANSSFLSRGVGVGFQTQSSNSHDPDRRTFGSPVYPNSQKLYGWQNTLMTSNGPMSSSYYGASPQTPLSTQGAPYQLPPPTTQQPMLPPMTQHHFDGLPTARQFDSGPAIGSIVRTGSLGHPHQIPHGFQNYLQDNGYGNNDSDGRDDYQQIQHN